MSIQASDLIEHIRTIAAERPDYVYQTPDGRSACVYGWNGRPSCLVGHALEKANHAVFEDVVQQMNNEAVELLENGGLITGTSEEIDWLSNAQSYQDIEYSWEDAVRQADIHMLENQESEED